MRQVRVFLLLLYVLHDFSNVSSLLVAHTNDEFGRSGDLNSRRYRKCDPAISEDKWYLPVRFWLEFFLEPASSAGST